MDTITIRDIGPHSQLQIPVHPGINVISGDNETGKSIAIRCVQALAGGDAKTLPVRDGQAGGAISGFGTTVQVGLRTKRAGDLDVETLGDRIDLNALVDPPLKDRAAANKHRIRALLTLTRATLTYKDFASILPKDKQGEITPEFDDSDPVDLAGSIKRAMEKQARTFEEAAEKANARAKALASAVDGIDFNCETDEAKLSAAHQKAVEEKARIEAAIDSAGAQRQKYEDAQMRLKALPTPPDMEALTAELAKREAAIESATAHRNDCRTAVEEARAALAKAEAAEDKANDACVAAKRAADDQRSAIEAAKSQADAIADLTAIVAEKPPEGPTAGELAAAVEVVNAASSAMLAGAEARRAADKKAEAQALLKEQGEHHKAATIYRNAAGQTDVVLTNAVKSDVFTVEAGELHAKDHAGVSRPYDDLSEGARYKIALLAVAQSVPMDSGFYIVTLDQRAWDGLGDEIRDMIDDAAREHNIGVVTGELASGEELKVRQYREQVTA